MKYLIPENAGPIKFNEETLEVSLVENKREAIRSIHIIDEPGMIIDNNGTETPVKKGDIVVRFYENYFPNRFVVVKSKDWRNNIETYEKKLEEQRNKALEAKNPCKACCDECCDCQSKA